MKKLNIILSMLVVLSCHMAVAQDDSTRRDKFSKHFLFGGTFQSAFTSIAGEDLPETYFHKPSVGGIIHAEYFPIRYIGIGVGFGYAQKGAGIRMPDHDGSVGNPDSTNRKRLRFHCWDVPLYLAFRSPVIGKSGICISGRGGVSFSYNWQTTEIFHSVEDGFHDIRTATDDYYRNDMNLMAALGVDINAGHQTLFQVQFFIHRGSNNIYNNESRFGSSNGRNTAFGVQLGFFY